MSDKLLLTLKRDKILLSGSRRAFKTEGFIATSKKTAGVDGFLSRLAEGLFYEGFRTGDGYFSAQTADGMYTFFFCGAANDERTTGGDIVFYKFLCAQPEAGTDRRLAETFADGDVCVSVGGVEETPDGGDLARLYLVTSGDGALNFPLLNAAQRKIVETEDANMLVQGVAGSGKTNVCVEKIVYCACRGYRGKVLYTTFSRGLLTETKNRVGLFVKNIESFIRAYEAGNVVFCDAEHGRAISGKLGIKVDSDDDAEVVKALRRVTEFLNSNVDYYLIEDIYADFCGEKKVAGESDFLRGYLGKGFRLSGALEKIKHIAPELIYKEIYGMIFGKYDLTVPTEMMSRGEYAEARAGSFTKAECDVIYSVACDYAAYLKRCDTVDNNSMSRELLAAVDEPIYSVGIIDEVQDFTQVNLCLIKKLSRKLFCVGDALQMINPSYFSFSYLKRLMYGDVTGISELKHNYRSGGKIEEVAKKLGELNVERFGVHSFVLKGESVESSLPSEAVFINSRAFCEKLRDKQLENITVIVASREKKERLKKLLGKTEVLTVAEAKGLERDTVVLADVLSDNIDKWNYLEKLSVNRKTADENSVFRYYFNLFYVGVSRARRNLFVSEGDYPASFKTLFSSAFSTESEEGALKRLKDVAGKLEMGDDEFIDRIEKFCSLGQYENARYAADRLSKEELRREHLIRIDVHEKYLQYAKYREAGVEYWKRGLDGAAREMFLRSGDEALFPLMDACKNGGGALDVGITRFYPIVGDNETAKKLILDTLRGDLAEARERQKQIDKGLKIGRKKR